MILTNIVLSEFLSGASRSNAPPPPPPPDPGIGLVANVGIGLSRPPVDFVFHTGDVAMRFVDYRKIREVKAPVLKLAPKPVYKEDSELQEMLGLYAGWRKAA
jgi:hypothetical protein